MKLISSDTHALLTAETFTISASLDHEAILQHLNSLLLHGNIKTLIFRGEVSDDAMAMLVKFLTPRNKLRSLRFKVDSGGRGYTSMGISHLSTLIGRESSLCELEVCISSDESLLLIARSLQSNSSLVTLHICINGILKNKSISEFEKALEVNHSILNLKLISSSYDGRLTKTQWEHLLAAVEKSKSIRHLTLGELDIDILTNFLQHNTSLRILSFCYPPPLGDIICIANALSLNENLMLEDLKGCSLSLSLEALGLHSSFKFETNRVILRSVKEIKRSSEREVYRVKMICVGDCAVGKSTLIYRLQNKVSPKAQLVTNGIDISYFKMGEIELSVFDLAAGFDYEHTHSLFFDETSIYLLFYCPRDGSLERLKVYQQMILNSAPKAKILFVTTRADEMRLTSEELETIREECPNICGFAPVDSISGTGIMEFEEIFMNLAMSINSTTQTIPSNIDQLRHSLHSFSSTHFNISKEEVRILGTSSLGMEVSMVDRALKLFVSWGYIFLLPSGDFILKPQQLADALACIFTNSKRTKYRIGDVKVGILRHTDEVLDTIWGRKFPSFSKSLWRCTRGQPLSPFISMLHQTGLAFELFDSQSKPLGVSLIPGLLPSHPPGLGDTISKVDYLDQLCERFIPRSLSGMIHPRVSITFNDNLPTAFVGRLQVKLRRMATLGGAWRRGCCLVSQHVDALKKSKLSSAPRNTNQARVASLVIISQAKDDVIELISAGADTSARSTVLFVLNSLLLKQFPCLSLKEIKITYEGKEYGQQDIFENLSQGFISHLPTHEKIIIRGLQILFPNLSSPSFFPPADNPSLTFLDEDNPLLHLWRQLDLKKFQDLEREVSDLELRSEQLEDFVIASEKFLGCISPILDLMGLKYSQQNGLSTLWIICENQRSE